MAGGGGLGGGGLAGGVYVLVEVGAALAGGVAGFAMAGGGGLGGGVEAPEPAVGVGLAGGGFDAGGVAAAALASVLASSEAPPSCVSAVLASTVASVPTSEKAASSMGLPSSPDAGSAPPPRELGAISLPHPQGATAAHARAAIVIQCLEARSIGISWFLCLGRQSTSHSNRALGRAVSQVARPPLGVRFLVASVHAARRVQGADDEGREAVRLAEPERVRHAQRVRRQGEQRDVEEIEKHRCPTEDEQEPAVGGSRPSFGDVQRREHERHDPELEQIVRQARRVLADVKPLDERSALLCRSTVEGLSVERRARLSASEVPARKTNDGAHRCAVIDRHENHDEAAHPVDRHDPASGGDRG